VKERASALGKRARQLRTINHENYAEDAATVADAIPTNSGAKVGAHFLLDSFGRSAQSALVKRKSIPCHATKTSPMQRQPHRAQLIG
jgi:hypothetical protein